MAENNLIELTVYSVKKARECPDRYVMLSSMKLTKEPDEDLERRQQLKTALIRALTAETEEKAREMWDLYMIRDYVNLPGADFVEAGEIAGEKGRRFIRWFYANGYTVKAVGCRYAFLPEGFELSGKKVKITDTVDLFCEKDGGTVMMNLSWSSNPYSDRARKPENKSENAIEALSMMTGNRHLKADAAVAYLTSRDDRNKALAKEFEEKPGKNLLYVPFMENAAEKLKTALSIKLSCNCEDCRLCKECAAEAITVTEEKKGKKEVTGNNEVSYTASQEKVVGFGDGRMCVVAVPGAGKTFALVERTKALIAGGVDPSSILMATFTKKAAAEYADRVARSCPKGVQPDAFTLHALAHYIITDVAGLGDKKKLATDIVRLSLIREAVSKAPRAIRGMSYDFRNGEFGLYRTLDRLFKNISEFGGNALTPEMDQEGIYAVYEIYRRLYEEENCFEYDDLIRECNALLDDPQVCAKVHEKWKYFMVDEVQDIDADQWEMVQKIESGNLLIVGDDDQQIFSWRGGSSQYMLDFVNYYPDGRVLYMEDNFRSTGNIISVAKVIADRIDNRYSKVITPVLKDEGKPVFMKGPCDDREITELIRAEIASGRYKPEDICVLARKNATLEKLGKALSDAGIRSVSPRTFLVESPVFDMLWCLFRLSEDGENVPETCLYRLRKYMGKSVAKEKGESLYEKYYRKEPEAIAKALDVLSESEDIEDAVSGCFKALTGARRISEEVYQLIRKLKEEEVETFDDLCLMMKDMLYFSDESELEVSKKEGYVNLLTCHRAKGKEYPFVILYGIEDFDTSESDLRLSYVAVTRAQKVCVVARSSLQEAPVLDIIKDKLTYLGEGEAV